jgi:hypothetical protein
MVRLTAAMTSQRFVVVDDGARASRALFVQDCLRPDEPFDRLLVSVSKDQRRASATMPSCIAWRRSGATTYSHKLRSIVPTWKARRSNQRLSATRQAVTPWLAARPAPLTGVPSSPESCRNADGGPHRFLREFQANEH